MKFSLFYFDGDGSVPNQDLYKLLLDSARYADENDFTAVWTPERHFHAFGGLYPNPTITSAALSMITNKIHILLNTLALNVWCYSLRKWNLSILLQKNR